MALLPNLICLGQPYRHFVIHVIIALEPEGVQMIFRRERFDAVETGIFDSTREHDMAVDPVPSNDECSKTHPHSKRDSCLLREHGDWPVSPGDAQHLVENRADWRRFTLEMGRKRVATTRMRLIPVCKLAAAFRTPLHGSAFVRGNATHFWQR
jgi:hypothetical protein